MSLRVRLMLVTLSVVSVMGVSGWTSYRINRRIRKEVEALDRTHELHLDRTTAVGCSLSIEGSWDGARFVVDEMERLPSAGRPKLRGPVEALDLEGGVITIYGRKILVTEDTEFEGQGASLAALAPGHRVEIGCVVEGDAWSARKIETEDIKESDKVKGTITASLLEESAGLALEIYGLPILVPSGTGVRTPRGPLYLLECAAEMGLSIQECLTAANELVREGYRRRALEESATHDWGEARDRFLEACGTLGQWLSECRRAEEAERDEWLTPEQRVARVSRLTRWIAPMEQRQGQVMLLGKEFVTIADRELERAQVFLDERMEPYLRAEFLPRISGYQSGAREAVSSELEGISARSDAAASLELTTYAAGLVVAIALGLFVSRSITKPVQELKRAAQEIGHGRLDTRVPVRSRDEIGILAETFNRMTEELARSTVSIGNLEDVQGELRRSLAEKELLLREVHHRVKNNMQVISSLLALQSRSISDAHALDQFQEMQDRIQAMVLVHEQLLKSHQAARIQLRSYLEQLVDSVARSHGLQPEGVNVRVEVEDLSLDMDRGQVCGLIVNELVTNSFKHAFRAGESGELRVSCRRSGASIVLEVADNGRGFEPDPARAAQKTIGLSLVSTLTRQLGGELRFDGTSGAVYHIEFPESPEEPA